MIYTLILSALAFALNFAWENVQCPVFFEHGSYDASLRGMTIATAGDVLLTWAVYLCVAVVSRRWRWARHPWRWFQGVTLVTTAFTLAVVIEKRAIENGLWTYREGVPLFPVFHVSVVPVTQLILLIPVTIALAERITSALGLDRTTSP